MPAARATPTPLGVVYTPPDVARAMTHLALAPLLTTTTGPASSRDLLSLRICDPAAGEGAFLVEIVAYLAAHLVTAWHREGRDPSPTDLDDARELVARTCIVGVDIDPHALHAASLALGSSTGLRPADALAIDWRSTFPDIFARGGFDVVLANPPYVRQESLASKATLEEFEVFDGVADLYVYFLELAHRLLRPRGRFCVIVPSKWLTVEYGRPLRSFLAASHTLDGIADLSTHALFADADAFPCIVWGTMGASRDRDIIGVRAHATDRVDEVLQHALARASSVEDAASVADASSLAPAEASSLANPSLLALGSSLAPTSSPVVSITRARWSSDPWHIDSSSDRSLLDRLAQAYPTLGEVIGTRWSRGVVTGLNEAFILDRTTRDALVSLDPACASWIRPFVKGRDIRSYIAPSMIERSILLVDRGTPLESLPAPIRDHLARFRDRLEPRPPEHAGAWSGRKAGAYAWHELQDPVIPLARSREPRFFYQDIQTAPACCFDRDGDLVPDTTVWILPSRDRYLLAILNSRLYHWYARRRFPPALNGAVRPKLAYMQRLPIPTPSSDLRREIEALVERRLGGDSASQRTGAVRLRADTSNTVLEAQIERLVEIAFELSSFERALLAG